jgi:hypothetical protein
MMDLQLTVDESHLLRDHDLLPDISVCASWDIIALKVAYYDSARVHPSWQKYLDRSDAEYDQLEDVYRAHGGSYSCDMVGIDTTRPSVRVVLDRLAKPKGAFAKSVRQQPKL